MLAFDPQETGVNPAGGAIVRKDLDDVRLRRDRVGGNHLDPRQPDGLGDGMAAFEHAHHGASSFSRLTAFRGHSAAQRPHPLQ